MNLSASQCSSSGCESGWTMYLDQSSLTKNQFNNGFSRFVDGDYTRIEEEEEEEDLSMVSDASSGPPHYCEDEDYFDRSAEKAKKKNMKKKSKENGRTHQHLYLDDTASSPELSKKVSKNEDVSEFSQSSSATHFKGKSALKKHFGFFQSASKDPGGFQGRKWQ